jgi:hypothetical protein
MSIILAIQENRSLKTAQAKTSRRAGGVAQCVGPEFKPQYRQKKKKEKKEREY